MVNRILTNKKRIIKWIVLIIVLIFILNEIMVVLRPKSAHGIKQSLYMYAQPRNTIDVAFMGSSHIHCGVNTKMLWDEYGIASYDYSAAEQPLWITYYYLKELCKYQKPSLVVLDLYSPARYSDDYQYTWLSDNLNGVKFSSNKIMMANTACESDRIFSYFPSFFNYHSRYDEVGMDDIKELLVTRKDKQSFKGYTPYYNVAQLEELNVDYSLVGTLSDKSNEYLMKIIEYARENNIELYFIAVPYYTTTEDESVYNAIEKIADENGIKYNGTRFWTEEAGLDYSMDFNDLSHLNFEGSNKFTSVLGEKIKAEYTISDRRGDSKWESWDRQKY